MAFLSLNLYEHPSGVAFDPAKVIEKVRENFPEAIIKPGDQAAEEVRRAEALLTRHLETHSQSPPCHVVESLRRKAKHYGPNFGFTIPRGNDPPIQGLARSVNVQFLFEEPLADAIRDRLIGFLKSLGVGRLEASSGKGPQPEILADLRGESDCLREGLGVPWKQ